MSWTAHFNGTKKEIVDGLANVFDRQDIYFYLPFDYYEDALRATERLNNVHCK